MEMSRTAKGFDEMAYLNPIREKKVKEYIDKLRVKVPNTTDIIMEAIELLKTLSDTCPICGVDISLCECDDNTSKQSIRDEKDE